MVATTTPTVAIMDSYFVSLFLAAFTPPLTPLEGPLCLNSPAPLPLCNGWRTS